QPRSPDRSVSLLALPDALQIFPGLQGPACGWGEAVQQLELGALPQWGGLVAQRADGPVAPPRALNQEHIVIVEMGADTAAVVGRSEEHTSELQSRENLVCRLLL